MPRHTKARGMSQPRGRSREARQPETDERRQPRSRPELVRPRGAGVYPRELVPIALAGDFVRLRPEDEVRQVRTVVSVPTIRGFDQNLNNGITATAGQITSDQDVEELEQRQDWLGQFRFLFPESDIPNGIDRVLVDLGGGQSPLYTTSQQRGHIEDDTSAVVGYSGLTEFYVLGDDSPLFSFDNTGGTDVTVNDIRFGGYEYQLSQPTELPENTVPVTVPTEAIGSVGR